MSNMTWNQVRAEMVRQRARAEKAEATNARLQAKVEAYSDLLSKVGEFVNWQLLSIGEQQAYDEAVAKIKALDNEGAE